MAEQNGSDRLDRIERAIELMISDHERFREEHEQFREEHKALLRAQVVQQDHLERLTAVVAEHSLQIARNSEQIARNSEQIARTSQELDALGRKTDAQIEALVSAIAKLVPPNPAQSAKPH